MRHWKFWRFPILVLLPIASIVLVILLSIPAFYKGLVGLPAVLSIFLAFLNILKEERAHQQQAETQGREQNFTLAAATHMANRVFDKHVEFVEAYFEKMNEGIQRLEVAGPKATTQIATGMTGSIAYAIDLANALTKIRLKYVPWLSEEEDASLAPFEQALRRLGAQVEILKMGDLPAGEERKSIVNEIYDRFLVLTNSSKSEKPEEQAIAASKIIEHLREILGTAELTRLRKAAIQEAVWRVEGKGGAA